MGQIYFYRYVSEPEYRSIMANRVIVSWTGRTYFTPDRYQSAAEAQRKLALGDLPAYRIGPVPADELPDFDEVKLQTVRPDPILGLPGGGVEAATTQITSLFNPVRLEP